MKRRAPSPIDSKSKHYLHCPPSTNFSSSPILLAKYHYRFLGSLERDLDSFNHAAGLPSEVIEVLSRLLLLTRKTQNISLFLRSPLLSDFVEFLLKIPEGLVPTYYVSKLCSVKSDQSIRNHLKSLPLENYCALKCIAIFINSVNCGESVLRSTGICEVLTPAPRDDRFVPLIIKIFSNPSNFFPVKNEKK